MNEINEIVIVLMISLVLILGGVIVYLVIEIVKVSKKESKNGIDHNIRRYVYIVMKTMSSIRVEIPRC